MQRPKTTDPHGSAEERKAGRKPGGITAVQFCEVRGCGIFDCSRASAIPSYGNWPVDGALRLRLKEISRTPRGAAPVP